MQVLSRMRESLGVELPLRALFESPTVAAIAKKIEQQLKAGARSEISPVARIQRTGELPLSYAQQRLWMLEQLTPDSAAYNIPAKMKLHGHLNVDALEQSFSEIERRHEVLRTVFPAGDGQPVQVINLAEPRKLPIVNLSRIEKNRREKLAQRIAAAEARRLFDLSRGPLMRTTLLYLEEQEHTVLFSMHHIATDGWSVGVLVREISSLYQAFRSGEQSPLPELTVQYVDYAAWQRQRLRVKFWNRSWVTGGSSWRKRRWCCSYLPTVHVRRCRLSAGRVNPCACRRNFHARSRSSPARQGARFS